MPRNFDLVSQRKGFKRYLCPELRGLVAQLDDAKERREDALRGILQVRKRRGCECIGCDPV